MYERFTDRSRKVMQLANQEAQRLNHEYIGTEHMLLGLMKEGSGVAAHVLRNLYVDPDKVRREVELIVRSGPAGDQVVLGKLPNTPRVKKVIEYSIDEARNLNHNYVGTEHLLLGLLREQEGVAAQVLMNLGVKLEVVRQEVLDLLGHHEVQSTNDPQPRKETSDKSKTPTLDAVGRDLTGLARRDKLDRLIGREAELAALSEVLTCRGRINPILIGEPGVGKSTLVAGLAQAIADGRAPEWLRSWRVVLIPIGHWWADAERARTVTDRALAAFNEVRRARERVLYLPDAVASLGGPSGGPTAERVHAQLLHALWTEDVPCILTATPAEYRRCVQRRPGLEGTVQPIFLRPATPDETIDVLRGLRERYEKYHGVGILNESLTAAVAAADRLPGALPGKAVVLLDRAAARTRIKAETLSPEIGVALRDLDAEIERLNREKMELVAATDFELAAERRDRADALQKQKQQLLQDRQAQRAVDATVDPAVVAEVARDMGANAPPGGAVA